MPRTARRRCEFFRDATAANAFAAAKVAGGERVRAAITDDGSFHACRAFFVVTFGAAVRKPMSAEEMAGVMTKDALIRREIAAFKASSAAD
jgi:hypothetical protein